MQTSIVQALRDTPDGQEADRILRACTHCGFCNATCPTYQLLGDERDGPRGRIYQIKQVLEGATPTQKTQQHLDRCLTCRACETTCPSGVEYSKLADIGRELVDEQVQRPRRERVVRWLLRHVVAYRRRFAMALKVGRFMRPLLRGPLAPLARQLPRRQPRIAWPPVVERQRVMLVHEGCVQPSATPNTNAYAARILDHLGIRVVAPSSAGCCGALSQHLSHREQARAFARANIDAWWPWIEQGAEAIISTASGCGASLTEYNRLLRDDPEYADKARRVTGLVRDLSEVLAGEDLSAWEHIGGGRRVAYHAPCTMQNAPGNHDHVGRLLARLGFELMPIHDAHICCGSAGSYSIVQPELAQQLRANKINNLEASKPDAIVTANIGCQMHLDAAAGQPVRHWIELLGPELDMAARP